MQVSTEVRPEIAIADVPSSLVQSLADPLIADLSYLAMLGATGRPLGETDVIAMLIVVLLSLPGAVPYRSFSWHVLQKLLLRWAALVVLLVLIGEVVQRALNRSAPLFDLTFIAAWAMLALVALLVAHVVCGSLFPWIERLQQKSSAVIVGVNAVALRVASSLASGERAQEHLLGYFDDRSGSRTGVTDASLQLGSLALVAEYVRRHRVKIIYICLPMSPSARLLRILEELKDTTASIRFVLDISVSEVFHGRVRMIGGVPAVCVRETPLAGASGVLKRALDLGVCAAALPLALPLMAVIAVAIRLTSPGPAIFKQRRFGLDGTEILVWKFRTMRTIEDGDRTYRQVTRDDDRVTPVGRLLRASSLDELPQLLNVLAGTMSIVGPRPHALAVNEQFRRLIPGYMIRHKIKPGITGWAQVHGYRGGDNLDAMRKRTEFDLQYFKIWSIGLDLLIIWKTAVLLATGDSRAY